MKAWLSYPRGALALLILVAFVIFSLVLHLPHDVEHWSADLVTSISATSPSQRDDIVLVYISDATLADLPYVSPIDRGRLAELMDEVGGAGAKVIGLDIILDRPTEEKKDNLLQTAFRHPKNNAKVVLGVIDEKEGSSFQRDFRKSDGSGSDPKVGCLYFEEHHAQGLVVSDHVVRFMAKPIGEIGKLPGKNEKPIEETNKPCTNNNARIFAEALAEAAEADFKPEPSGWDWLLEHSPHIAWLSPPVKTETWPDWGRRLPECMQSPEKADTWSEWLRRLFYCPRPPVKADTFLTLPAEYVLGLGKTEPQRNEFRNVLKGLLRDKIVLIGGNFADRDQHLTPLSVSRDDFYPGLFIHAQILAQLIDKRVIREFNWPMCFVLIIVAVIAGFMLGLRADQPDPVAHFRSWKFWFRKNHRTYFWIEVVGVIVISTIAVFAFFGGVIFPFNAVLIAFLTCAAVGHYA